jgi:hypothetical protein
MEDQRKEIKMRAKEKFEEQTKKKKGDDKDGKGKKK